MEELMWVKIETTKGNDDIWSFKGQILKAVFEGIISNQLNEGYFKLDKVYWITTNYDDNGDEYGEKLYQYGKGNLKSHRGDTYLKIEHLVTIAPIDGEMELAKFQKDKGKTLSLVSPIRP
ncbi:hypothetical protein [Agarilytica rhodophyticola]|uniref:hypothetical protein n=1 Tax=Agarilytica rhodophyticola TaxID=1737490 RepID=UPI000B34311C|nr:hypothetical protein [Agarilytica rhodophyticola]